MARFRNEDRWDPLVRPEAAAQNVSVALVKAVIGNETGFRWVGDSHPIQGTLIQTAADLDRSEPRLRDASVGVMQVLTRTAQIVLGGTPVTREELRVPAFNIHIGTVYLSQLLNGWRPDIMYNTQGNPLSGLAFPDPVRPLTVEETLAVYNGGPRMLDRLGGAFPNQRYVDDGLQSYNYFSEQEQQLPTTPPAGPSGSTTVALIFLAFTIGGILYFALRR